MSRFNNPPVPAWARCRILGLAAAALTLPSQLPAHEAQAAGAAQEEITIGSGEPLDARITLRLPTALKELIEGAASSEGDSVNSWIVKSLNTNAAGTTGPSRVRGTYEL